MMFYASARLHLYPTKEFHVDNVDYVTIFTMVHEMKTQQCMIEKETSRQARERISAFKSEIPLRLRACFDNPGGEQRSHRRENEIEG